MLLVAALAGFGGGNFASSMANITFFYPQREKGWALGLNAAGGNLGAAVAQLAGADRDHRSAPAPSLEPAPGWMWIPLILLPRSGAWKLHGQPLQRQGRRSRASAAAREGAAPVDHRRSCTSARSARSSASPASSRKLINDQFPGFASTVGAASLAFLGALVGSLARPFGGRLADRFGGARVTVVRVRGHGRRASLVVIALPLGQLLAVPRLFLVLFVASGVGNGSTYRMIPAIFATPSRGWRRTDAGTVAPSGEAAAALGLDLRASAPTAGSSSRRCSALSTTAHRLLRPGALRLRRLLRRCCWRSLLVCYLRNAGRTAIGRATSDVTHGVRRHPLPVLRPAVRHDAARRPTGRGSRDGAARRDFPTNRGGLCKKGWTSPTLLDRAGPAHHARWSATPTGVARSDLGRGARPRRRARRAHAARARRGRRRRVRRRRAHQREGLPAGQVRPASRCGTASIDYNGRFCMSSAAAAGNRAFGLDRGLPFPLDRPGRRRRRSCCSAPTSPRRCRRSSRTCRARGTRAASSSSTRGARRRPRLTDDGPASTCSRPRAPIWRLLLGLTPHRDRRRPGDTTYLDERTDGCGRCCARSTAWWPERVQPVTGVPAPTIRRAARAACGGRPARRRGASSSPAVVSSSTSTAPTPRPPHQPRTRPRSARARGPRLRRSPARATARAAGSTDRSPTSFPGTARSRTRRHVRTWRGVWGVDPDLRDPGRSAVELLEALGTAAGRRRCWCTARNLVSRRPVGLRVRERLAALDLLVVSDFVPSETALLADVVLPVTQWAEEEGTMTTRGPRDSPPCACRAAS